MLLLLLSPLHATRAKRKVLRRRADYAPDIVVRSHSVVVNLGEIGKIGSSPPIIPLAVRRPNAPALHEY